MKKETIYFLCLLTIILLLSSSTAFSQVYVTWTSSSTCNNCTTVSGTGTITGATVPNLTWTSTAGAANKIQELTHTIGSDEMPLANPWETKYGTLNGTTSVLRGRHAGNATTNGQPVTAGATITNTINFSSPTFSSGWGFIFLDIDVDQMEIVSALDENNNAISAATINSWLKGVFDASGSPASPPCWDSTNLTLVGDQYVASPCVKRTTLLNATDGAGAAGWFEPNVRVKQLVVRFTNLTANGTPSFRLAIAAFQSGTVTGTVYNDNNANNAYNVGTDATLPNVSVELVNGSGTVVATTVTNSSGAYTFSNVALGTYTVRVVTSDTDLGGRVATAPSTASSSVTVTAGTTSTRDFGFRMPPDLTITKSHSGSFTVGSTGTYSFTVTNSGSLASSGTITVTDTLPAGLTVNGGAAGGITEGGTNAADWTCNSNSATPQVITCTSSTAIASTAGSNTSTFNFAVNVGLGTAVGTNSITNTATVSGGGETNTSNNSDDDPTTVLSPDLTIVKSHSGDFTRGSSGTYSMTIGNSGTVATSGTITVSDTLPTGLSIADGSITEGGANAADWTCNAASNVITCTSTTAIATSGSSIFSFTVNVSATAPNSLTNTATVSGGNEATAKNGNNSDDDPTNTISSPPNVTLVKSCPSPTGCTTTPQNPGTDLTYQIEFTNTGGLGAQNMAIVDGIPANTDFKIGSATSSVGTTGLTFVIEYSNDYSPASPSSATWTYTPVSGGGGAPSGYDRNVKAIRWRVTTGDLSNISPNNTGSAGFTVIIR
jgi:uncharacterized repeat protein (TIGR01451 family)